MLNNNYMSPMSYTEWISGKACDSNWNGCQILHNFYLSSVAVVVDVPRVIYISCCWVAVATDAGGRNLVQCNVSSRAFTNTHPHTYTYVVYIYTCTAQNEMTCIHSFSAVCRALACEPHTSFEFRGEITLLLQYMSNIYNLRRFNSSYHISE